MTMRRCCFVFALFIAGFVRAEIPVPLKEALDKMSNDFDRWAYTETRRSTDTKGRVTESVVRFDPSKPYAEQYTPISIDGKEPTKKQLAEHRKRGVKRGERLAKAEAEGKGPGAAGPRFSLNDSSSSIDLEHATLRTDAPAGALLYDVPLKNDGKGNIPVEKFQLVARVNAETHLLENVSLKLLDSFRMKLVAKIKSGGASIDFSVVDPKFAPVFTAAAGEAAASIMFVSFGGKFDTRRTDFQRVKPYAEKFGVQIGPLRALDF